ncbi:MAG: SPOR domain-containing protein [Bryobacteraceae bacterium]
MEMLRTNDSETEILLGNKQLLGIFFVVAILLGVAFTGGYMVGRGSLDKAADAKAPAARSASATETHAVSPDSSPNDIANASAPISTSENGATTESKRAGSGARPLGSPRTSHSDTAPEPTGEDTFAPERGQTFLQVAAVGRDEAVAIADVLHKKGFRAHAVPKPGSPKFYRVLIGPIRDTTELSSTRDSLRKTGFREVIVQKYQ